MVEIPSDTPLAVTVLGSGGPGPQPRRASSGYLVWVDGQPTVLVDASGSSTQRLAEMGVTPADLDLIVLTHLHIDHSGGLASVLFEATFDGRAHPFTVLAPSGRDSHPGGRRFCDLLFGPDGAWPYLRSWEGFEVVVTEVDCDPDAPPARIDVGLPQTVVRAVGVPHGTMPAVAYRFEHGGRSVAFTGDIAGQHDGLVELARGVDLLVHDQALPRRNVEHGANHSPPADTAANAAAAEVGTLLLSHLMVPAEERLDEVLVTIRQGFEGTVVVAEDGLTIAADGGRLDVGLSDEL